MARIKWNPKGSTKGENPSPIAWGCSIFMRQDGTLEMEVTGQTGQQMMKAAMGELHAIHRLRQEPAYNFGVEQSS
jgi:hypothetical protein